MACEANNNCKLQKNLILSLVCKTSLLPRARHCVHSLSLLCFLRCRSRIRKVAKAARIATKATAPTTMPTMLPVDSPFDVVCTTATGHIGKTTIWNHQWSIQLYMDCSPLSFFPSFSGFPLNPKNLFNNCLNKTILWVNCDSREKKKKRRTNLCCWNWASHKVQPQKETSLSYLTEWKWKRWMLSYWLHLNWMWSLEETTKDSMSDVRLLHPNMSFVSALGRQISVHLQGVK